MLVEALSLGACGARLGRGLEMVGSPQSWGRVKVACPLLYAETLCGEHPSESPRIGVFDDRRRDKRVRKGLCLVRLYVLHVLTPRRVCGLVSGRLTPLQCRNAFTPLRFDRPLDTALGAVRCGAPARMLQLSSGPRSLATRRQNSQLTS